MPHIGIFSLNLPLGGGGARRTLALADHLCRRYRVTLITGSDDRFDEFSAQYGVDLSRVAIHRLPRRIVALARRFGIAPRLVESAARWTTQRTLRHLEALKLDLFINNHWGSNLPCPARRGIYMCMFPHALRGTDPLIGEGWRTRGYARLLGMPAGTLASYDTITANSEFTRSWIRKLWNRDATVVYSAAEPMGPPAPKEPMILNVGRFVPEGSGDYKHQGTLIQAFAELRDLHAAGWQMHFAGSVTPGLVSQQLMERLRQMAGGYPVSFHFNLRAPALRDLYRRAAVSWHATGYGYPAERYPHYQEHLGLPPVEAMSAGAVPVALNSGGHRETIAHGVNGFLWDDLASLRAHTHRLASDADLRALLSAEAVRGSQRFSRQAFLARMDAVVDASLCAT